MGTGRTERIDVAIAAIDNQVALLSARRTENLDSAQVTIEAAIALYQEADAAIKRFSEVRDAAEKLISDTVREDDATRPTEAPGRQVFGKPSDAAWHMFRSCGGRLFRSIEN